MIWFSCFEQERLSAPCSIHDVLVLVVSTLNAPKRSKAEIEAIKGAVVVTKFVEVPGAPLPQEECRLEVA
jgi:hypothetical protein